MDQAHPQWNCFVCALNLCLVQRSTLTTRLPSPSAIGFLNTPSFSIARLIGGIIALRYSHHGKVPLAVIVVASGFVLGEGLTSIVGLVMKSAGLGVVSCFGCHRGEGGYCSSC